MRTITVLTILATFLLSSIPINAEEGPTPCLTGTIIFGEGENAGKIELQGFPFVQYLNNGPNRKPGKRTLGCRSGFSGNIIINKTADHYKLLPIMFPGYEPYLILKGDSPPVILLRKGDSGVKFTLHPVYQVTKHYMRHGNGQRFEAVTRMKGQTIGEGRCYSTLPRATQEGNLIVKPGSAL